MSGLNTTIDQSGKRASAPRDWDDASRLTAIHYVICLAPFFLYGYQVCPFLEGLSAWQLLAPPAVALTAGFFLRLLAQRGLRKVPVERSLTWMFWADFSVFVLCGFAVAAWNAIAFGFPLVHSGSKVLVGFLAIGFYVALDLTFAREINLARELRRRREAFPVSSHFMPYQTRFVLFSMTNMAAVSVVVVLVVLKDILWVANQQVDPFRAQALVFMELAFILGVMGAYLFRVISQYAKRIEFSLQDEEATLQAVSKGELGGRVTVASNDELGRIAQLTNQMITQLEGSLEEVERTRDVAINALVSLSAKRDNETGLHLKRTQHYIVLLARELQKNAPYQDYVTDDYVELLHRSAPLHDIGKVGIPDVILTKPGRLTAEEFEIMKTHAALGAAALREADRQLDGSSFLSMAHDIALSHHEKWDGSGYPHRLAGEAIPLSARLMAVADVYDALRTQRVYKPAMPHAKAAAIIREGAGAHFDPDVVAAFEAVEAEFIRVSETMQDRPEQESSAA
ncbi:MAG: HD domain-containing phosphohydrolase [Pseudomonadota bacterium]